MAQHQDIHNPNIVKVVLDAAGRALYFSRAAIPCWRDAPVAGQAPNRPTPDMGLLSEKFRAFCITRNLSLTSANIEKAFIGWVSKFKVG